MIGPQEQIALEAARILISSSVRTRWSPGLFKDVQLATKSSDKLAMIAHTGVLFPVYHFTGLLSRVSPVLRVSACIARKIVCEALINRENLVVLEAPPSSRGTSSRRRPG